MFKRCCCHYAPTIIVLDIVILLIMIGEMILVFPNRKVQIIEDSTTGNEDQFIIENGQLKPNPLSHDTTGDGINSYNRDFYLWEGSNYSVFVIPVNTIFVCLGLRILFCKLHSELMKVILILDLLALYISSVIGLICYLIASSENDYFKTNFFL